MNIVKHKEEATEVIAHDVEPLIVDTDDRRVSRLGWLVVLLGFGGFMLWALFAPLDKGVPMSGFVAKESNRQTVQHEHGGTVAEILVRNGDQVKQGQVLVRMNSVTAQSNVDVSRAQYYTARAAEARLLAERDGASSIRFPEELTRLQGDARVAEVLELQRQLFSSRQAALQSELSGLEQSVAGLKLQIRGLEDARTAKQEQIKIIKEQLDNTRELAREGYVARSRLLELERLYAQLTGEVSEDTGNIGRARQQVVEQNLRISQRRQDYQKEVRTQLSEVQKEAEAVGARLTAQHYELAKVDVTSPVDGTVVGLNVFTRGGVVPPGFRLMDVVPKDDPLVVDGQLPVNLIDRVHKGLPVELIFSAFNTNTTPHIQGEVINVAADRTVDEKTGAAFYVVRARVTPEGVREMQAKKLVVQPGMPVELFVKTGERTMMSYLLKPIVDRMHSSLSEE